ncbi:hypothetical protein DNTS_035033 [Danionella cerebrum]|uniref:Uncharacterized protein n=1 Tax=Danionella cerebrum TaxID=2873325 RepID=A0A553QZG6_9TELE|nr:hypothetical protein DNTS_035033 [Danionella translucida]
MLEILRAALIEKGAGMDGWMDGWMTPYIVELLARAAVMAHLLLVEARAGEGVFTERHRCAVSDKFLESGGGRKARAVTENESDHSALFVSLAVLCGKLVDPAELTVAVFAADVSNHVTTGQHDAVLDLTVLQRKALPVAPVKRVLINSDLFVRMVSQLAQENKRVPPMWSRKILPMAALENTKSNPTFIFFCIIKTKQRGTNASHFGWCCALVWDVDEFSSEVSQSEE